MKKSVLLSFILANLISIPCAFSINLNWSYLFHRGEIVHHITQENVVIKNMFSTFELYSTNASFEIVLKGKFERLPSKELVSEFFVKRVNTLLGRHVLNLEEATIVLDKGSVALSDHDLMIVVSEINGLDEFLLARANKTEAAVALEMINLMKE